MGKSKTVKERSLKEFLIGRFILIVVVVAASENLISFVFSEWMYPFLSKLLNYSDLNITSSSPNALFNGVQIVVIVILTCILALLPNYISEGLEIILRKFSWSFFQIKVEAKIPTEINSHILENLYYWGILILFLLILAVILSPYFIAAVTFSRMVTRKVEKPIRGLTNGMEKVSQGELTTRLSFETEHEFVQLLRAFNQMAAQMEADAKEKRDFEEHRNALLADIAHDLKTPITTISGYATALADGVVKDEEKEKKYLEAIKTKSLHMDELIMLLFEYVKLDSEGFTLNKEEVDIAELLRENVALLYTDFETNKMEIDMDIPDEGVMYSVDQVQFSRVIVNILNNAIRYNPPGTLISVKLFVEEGLRIKIADTGNVIEGDIASHIFEPFVTGDKSRNTRGGSGLGLSIAKKVVVMHGGDLILSIKEEKYTKAFVISLPKVR